MSILIFLTVAWTAVFGGIKMNHTIPALQIQNMPTTSGLFIFSFAGHIVFPNIQAGMKDPSKFTKVGTCSFPNLIIFGFKENWLGKTLYVHAYPI